MKKQLLQIRFEELEIDSKEFSRFQNQTKLAQYDGISVSKVIEQEWQDGPQNKTNDDIRALFENLNKNQEIKTLIEFINQNPKLTENSFIKLYFYAFPLEMLSLSYLNIDVEFFSGVIEFIHDKNKFFSKPNLDEDWVLGFSENFLESLIESNVKLEDFNLLDLRFSSIPNSKLNSLLKLCRFKLTKENETHVLEELLLMISYEREDSIKVLFKKLKGSKIFIEKLITTSKIPAKYKKLLNSK
jgi:hypothetical protein